MNIPDHLSQTLAKGIAQVLMSASDTTGYADGEAEAARQIILSFIPTAKANNA